MCTCAIMAPMLEMASQGSANKSLHTYLTTHQTAKRIHNGALVYVGAQRLRVVPTMAQHGLEQWGAHDVFWQFRKLFRVFPHLHLQSRLRCRRSFFTSGYGMPSLRCLRNPSQIFAAPHFAFRRVFLLQPVSMCIWFVFLQTKLSPFQRHSPALNFISRQYARIHAVHLRMCV